MNSESAAVIPIIAEGMPPGGGSGYEMVRRVRQGIVLDNLEKLSKLPQYGRALVLTCDEALAEKLQKQADVMLYKGAEESDFRFGELLAGALRRRRPPKALYLSGGMGYFLEKHHFRRIAEGLRPGLFITNNLYSSDLAAFCGEDLPAGGRLPAKDNGLAWHLANEAGLRPHILTPSLSSCFDIDTPTDVLVMKACLKEKKGAAAEALAKAPSSPAVEKLRLLLHTKGSEILLWGRINPTLAAYLERRTQARYTLYSEERGLKARGKKADSFLCRMLEETGGADFFKTLSERFQGAVIDSRIAFSHFAGKVSVCDRFYSDLGMANPIENTFIKEFTGWIGRMTVPAVTGGHSLVSGGLRLLAQTPPSQ